MALLAALLEPVVRRFSANQPPEHPGNAHACDRAHAGQEGDRRASASPAHRHAGGLLHTGFAIAFSPPSRLPSGSVVDSVEPRSGRASSPHTAPYAPSLSTHAGGESHAGQAVVVAPGYDLAVQRRPADGTIALDGVGDDAGVPAEPSISSTTADDQPRSTPLPVDMPRRQRTLVGDKSLSGSLPSDDGMAALRRKIHEIRDMAASSEDKARRLHELMTESYVAALPRLARAQSPESSLSGDRPFTPASPRSPPDHSGVQSPLSPASLAEPTDPANPYHVTEEDRAPTFRPSRSRRPSIEYEIYTPGLDDTPETPDPQLGCKHYKRNVKIQCFDCKRWHTCRHCHDEHETGHSLVRRKTENMLCMVCQTPQAAGESCSKCGLRAAWYYCDICKLWDDDSTKRIYHCADCGICRRGEGIGKDFVHCKRCNICIAIGSATTHRCIERAAECDCPICGEYMFTSSASIVAMPCGHYLHKACYTRYMETAYKCPICKKSAVNMELQWRKLEQAIESQPMPREFRDTRIVIQCNDCSAKSSVRYHWLGNQCSTCDSFNTNELQLLGPGSEEAQRNTADHRRQRIEPLPPPMQIDDTDVRLRLQTHRSRTLPTGPPQQQQPGSRLAGSYFLSVQDSTSDTSMRRSAIAQNIPFSPLEMFNRVSRSLSPISNYLIATDSDSDSDSDSLEGVGFWGADGSRFLSGDEDDSSDSDSDEDESDEAAGSDDDDDDDDGGGGGGARRLDGHGHARRELDDLDDLTGHR